MEEEVRVILRASVSERQLPDGLGTRIHARFAALGGVELELPTREDKPRAAVLDQ
jgi:plasmid stability protein